MNGWIIATIVLGYLLFTSLLAIVINGIEDKWTFSNYASIFFFIIFLPIAFPFFIWNAVYERRQKALELTEGIPVEKCDGCERAGTCEGDRSLCKTVGR